LACARARSADSGRHALSHDVTHDQHQAAVGQREHVVPVAAHVGVDRAGPEAGRDLQAGHLGEAVRQQAALQCDGRLALTLVEAGPFQRDRALAAESAEERVLVLADRLVELEDQRADTATGDRQIHRHPGPCARGGRSLALQDHGGLAGAGRRPGRLGDHSAYVVHRERLAEGRGGPLQRLGALGAAPQGGVRPAALGDVRDEYGDTEDLAAGVARREPLGGVVAALTGHRRLRGEVLVDHDLPRVEHLAQPLLDLRPEIAEELAGQLPDMVGHRQPVDLGEHPVDPPVAQVGAVEGEGHRRLEDEGFEQRGIGRREGPVR
jgi:hypothetical protein